MTPQFDPNKRLQELTHNIQNSGALHNQFYREWPSRQLNIRELQIFSRISGFWDGIYNAM